MLKAVISYSKKIPVPDSEYSSQGYSLSLETEIPETNPEAIQAKLHDTFALVKRQVESELSGGKTEGTAAKPAATGSALAVVKDDAQRASNKQIKFITDLWTQGGGSVSDLNARILGTYAVDGLYELSRRQASDLVTRLKQECRKAA